MSGQKLSLTARALRLLARREHSRVELERKLAHHATEPLELAKVLDTLQARGFINETRVAQSLLHRRAARFGSARIRQELQAKGLAADAVSEAVSQLALTEMERARQVWQKKFGSTAPDAAQRARQSRFLASRGFSGELIARLLRTDVEE
jgi:regulatory protein